MSTLSCRDFGEILFDMHEGDLSLKEQASAEAHLAQCPDCASFVHTYQQIIEAIGRMEAPDVEDSQNLRLFLFIMSAFQGQFGNSIETSKPSPSTAVKGSNRQNNELGEG